ncbi:MAG: SsrA-binding protein [Candidatus Niyogibacteria bacterium RIFCSPLOWO2_01_FULL_45_48]|uniref:SsrA-binding protein n=2 Tax=Candidatus Niyogiibacteriota TaxID=1817912 RepID=A0A1G2EWI5_9BACT|nr:MAG: SsrA-binding protein [Candidatus Niyogibacteria bacterium RIFCSPHIGHO2_01_FULL_45_28]OGZ30166.1 MAG: SsrA-binding protein [Candidatus Niyogibacteria bacterium RIFCSPLOWO2_02_FULL_45_13]OGZ30912.1 MAG: SsrA-binding protein [Candidatus Niyogibacteria bacterium RIFCSPLOWO2_01_FULL_45_48]
MADLLQNKKVFFDYEILEKFEAGLELRGFEVKALRNKLGSILGARVIIRGGEAFVVGMEIPPYQPANTPKEYEPQRTRKLLLKKSEIKYLSGKGEERGLTIVPIRVYIKGRMLKTEVGIAKGKKKYDKREKIKKRESKRKIERELKTAYN